MNKLALTELWWQNHYGDIDADATIIKKHYIVDSYVELDDFFNINDLENVINKLRINSSHKPIYKKRRLRLELVNGFRLHHYEVCIKKTVWFNIFFRKCKTYLLQKKEKNIFYTNKLDINETIKKYINSFY